MIGKLECFLSIQIILFYVQVLVTVPYKFFFLGIPLTPTCLYDLPSSQVVVSCGLNLLPPPHTSNLLEVGERRNNYLVLTHRIHVLFTHIYHQKSTKCRLIYHTRILWASTNYFLDFKNIQYKLLALRIVNLREYVDSSCSRFFCAEFR